MFGGECGRKSRERNPLPGLVPVSLGFPCRHLFKICLKKMVLFLIVSGRRFLTVLGGVV